MENIHSDVGMEIQGNKDGDANIDVDVVVNRDVNTPSERDKDVYKDQVECKYLDLDKNTNTDMLADV